MLNIKLRPWQKEAITQAKDWYDKGNKVFLIDVAPGAGKTICASFLAGLMLESNDIKRVVVIAPRREVVGQWEKEFKRITKRPMLKVTGSDPQIEDYGTDVCATWQAVSNLLDGFQAICKSEDTLVICDEHHHAAEQASWGENTELAFDSVKHALILSGTPTRSDGLPPIWFKNSPFGKGLDHPKEGTYSLTYGEAVKLGYCRPITFHRHEGKFSVSLEDGEEISVSGSSETDLGSLKKIRGLQQALDYYKLACTPKYLPDETVDTDSYQATMLNGA